MPSVELMRSMPSPHCCEHVQRVDVNAIWVVRLYFEFDSKCTAPAVYAVLMREDSDSICCGTCGCMEWGAQCAVALFVSAADAHNNGIVRKLWDGGIVVDPAPTSISVFWHV